jgi:peptidoglycan/xylan/chitin deacetylase (PgdA/CDA1 family)
VTGWLDPLRRAMDDVAGPVPIFFRDDDAGWADPELHAVLDRFAAAGVAVDVAVIPAELTPRLTEELARHVERSAGRVALHQHGWSHTDHEREGRRCEFGPARSYGQQLEDVARGAAVMTEAFGTEAFGAGAPRLFVPPWNRCTATTAAVLAELGFSALCRDVTAAPLPDARVPELPVTVDWFAKRRLEPGRRDEGASGRARKEPVDRAGRGELLAAAVGGPWPVGVMLHHAVMGPQDLADLTELLDLVADDDRLRPQAMADGVAAASSALPGSVG